MTLAIGGEYMALRHNHAAVFRSSLCSPIKTTYIGSTG